MVYIIIYIIIKIEVEECARDVLFNLFQTSNQFDPSE